MADFTFAIVVPLASPNQPVATLNMTQSALDAANLIGARGVYNFKMILVELGVNSSMEEYATPFVWRTLDAVQTGEHRSEPMVW
jgi:hypothetical protein